MYVNGDRPPGFFLWVRDFLTDGIVETMTTEEIGAYFLLLCKAWFQNPPASVPDDDYTLAMWTKTSSRWPELKPRVMQPWTLAKDGRWHQKRMRLEFARMRELHEKKVRAGTIAAQARWRDADNRRIADAYQTQCDRNTKTCPPTPTPTPDNTTPHSPPSGGSPKRRRRWKPDPGVSTGMSAEDFAAYCRRNGHEPEEFA